MSSEHDIRRDACQLFGRQAKCGTPVCGTVETAAAPLYCISMEDW